MADATQVAIFDKAPIAGTVLLLYATGKSMALRYEMLRTACRRPIVVAALKVAIVVGTILNIINQGGRLLDGLQPSWIHVLLNYIVPYCVSGYSAARNEMRHGATRR